MKRIVTAQRNYNRVRDYGDRLTEHYRNETLEEDRRDVYPKSFGHMTATMDMVVSQLESLNDIYVKGMIQTVDDTIQMVAEGDTVGADEMLKYLRRTIVDVNAKLSQYFDVLENDETLSR